VAKLMGSVARELRRADAPIVLLIQQQNCRGIIAFSAYRHDPSCGYCACMCDVLGMYRRALVACWWPFRYVAPRTAQGVM